MNINKFIKNRRKELGLTMLDVAKACEVSEATVSRWESGDISNMKRSRIAALAKILRISPAIIVGVQDEFEYSAAGIDFTRIPLYDNLCCGNGGFVDDNILEMIPIPSKGLNPNLKYFAQYAHGKSMIGAGIDDGDLLVFEKVDKVNSGVIGCFCLDENNATCKKYKELESLIMLQPMNNDYEPIIIDPINNNIRCIGKLKKVIKDYEWED